MAEITETVQESIEITDAPAPEIIETPEVVEETAEVVETEVVAETEETADTETPEGEETAETVEEVAPITFTAEDDLSAILEKKDAILDKIDLSEAPEIVALIDALKTQAESNTIVELADYGDKDAIKATLEAHNNLHSVRPVEEGEGYRPNTDTFAKELAATAPEKFDWLVYDAMSQPSRKYQGLTKLQEINADSFAIEGDTVGTFLQRYESFQKYLLEGATVPDSDIPYYIPENLRGAYKQLAKESREELAFLDPKDDNAQDDYGDLLYPDNKAIRERKLMELARQQKGIDAELAEQRAKVESQQAEAQKLVTMAQETQEKFFTETRKSNLERLKKELNLSPLEAAQRLTLLENAFDQSEYGNFARQALEAEGIKFDTVRAASLVKAVESAAIEWTEANRWKDAEGKPINPVSVNKAARALETAGREWQKFADDIIKQQNKTATATEETKEQERIAKKKILPKARSVVSTNAASATKAKGNPHPYGTREWDAWYDQSALAAESAKARAYTN